MKEKIIIFLVGLLLGSIISTGSIYFYTIANNNEINEQIGDRTKGGMRENGSNPPEIPNNGQNNPRFN